MRRDASSSGNVLALKRIDSSRHSGVIALFHEHFVRTGAVPTEIGSAVPAGRGIGSGR